MAKGASIVGGVTAGIGLLTRGLVSSVKAASEAQQAQARLKQALKASGTSYGKYGKEIDAAIQKTSKLAAIDDEELSDSFALLVRTTGSVQDAMKGMNIAANVARGRNISLATATKTVERAFLGNDKALKRLGIRIPETTSNYDAAKLAIDAHKKSMEGLTGAQLEAAKIELNRLEAAAKAARALDKEANSLAALDKAQRKFAGSGEAYSKTLAGSHERFQIAVENLQESIGKHLLPVLTKLFIKGVEWIEWAEENWPKFAKEVEEMWKDVKPIFDKFSGYVDGWIKIIQGVIEGDWGLIWSGLKKVVENGFKLVYEYLRLVPARFFKFGVRMGERLADGILEGLKGLPEKIGKALLPTGQQGPGPGSRGGRYSPTTTPAGAANHPGKARGGSVMAGKSYIVGERGREVLTMGRMGGTIAANGGGGMYIGAIHLHGVQNVQQLVAEIQRVARHQGTSQRGVHGGQSLAFN